jgi:hypothetical protein
VINSRSSRVTTRTKKPLCDVPPFVAQRLEHMTTGKESYARFGP